MKTHDLKTWPEHFVDMEAGRKTFEVRRDDRGFGVGDVLVLREWSPRVREYSGAVVRVVVTHLLRGPVFGIADGHVVMSIARLDPVPKYQESDK